MSTVSVGCVVEGVGEVAALPVLLRRLAPELDPSVHLNVAKPIRIPRSRLLKAGELERATQLAALRAGHQAVLVVIDADDDLPCQLAPELLSRAAAAVPGVYVALVIAQCEYEAWLIAGAQSIAGKRGLRDDLLPPPNAESIRGAKEWLSDHMAQANQAYSPTLDQAALTASVDLAQAANTLSFRKLKRDLLAILSLA
jgi:hypothetical protein